MRKNIVFSTTRQWNPGDEIILKGVINLISGFGIDFNPIIFNRNPDIRSAYGSYGLTHIAHDEGLHFVKTSMMDNSIKPWTDYAYVDAIVFAGTPEWRTWRSRELFIKAIEYNLPVYMIGIDSTFETEDKVFNSVLKKVKFISVRNEDILDSFLNKGIGANYLPCPSIFASESFKSIDTLREVGLIYRGKDGEVTVHNGWDEEHYRVEVEEYKKIIKKYKDILSFRIICHYVDEVPLAKRDFPDMEIYYSYDAADYLDIYSACDYIVGSRIHGIGIATTLTIPSYSVPYDQRGGTLKGFKPKDYGRRDSLEEDIEYTIKNINFLNECLVNYKTTSLLRYKKLLECAIDFKKVDYEYPIKLYKMQIDNDAFKGVIEQADDIVTNIIINARVKMVISYINTLICGKKIVIRGAGNHTRQLLKLLKIDDADICIIDSDDMKKTLGKYTVFGVEELNNKRDVDYFIISSYLFEDAMRDDLIKRGYADKIISIYQMYLDTFQEPLNNDFYEYLNNDMASES